MIAKLRSLKPTPLSALALCLVLVSCESDNALSPTNSAGFSRAYDIWQPGPDDTCTREIHNQYSVVGPDGLLYPTWHPPIDPATGCSFGHDHGRDPSGSALYGEVGPIPFGLA
ncbi:MAG: hypothetical protein JSW51_03530, partial [Gemmatimonadota bacterium]